MIVTVLLNGLWQGVLIVAIAAMISVCISRRHAGTRYALWFVALLALAVLPVATLWHPTPSITTLPAPVVAGTTAIAAQATSDNGWWLMTLWIAGMALCLLRLVRSYLQIGRITRAALALPELGPDVLTSHDVAYPIAAGFLAPMVVLPTSFPETLERGDLEAIVRHERAHITRHDIFTNLVQRVVEACLFFNPWVYVVGRQLLREREYACDDWAVATADADRYASCLARLASGTRAHTPLLTPSAIGSRRMLVDRIARLLDGKATQLQTNYFVLGASTLAFVLLAVGLQTTTGQAAPTTVAATNSSLPSGCFHDVKVLYAAEPAISKADFKPNVEAGVLVTIAPDGHVLGTKLVKSSGSAAIDKATVDAAQASKYAAAVSSCKAIQSTYYFHMQTGQ
jgi:beta-lactamase regulating signal transducer with metallopeptidase domain